MNNNSSMNIFEVVSKSSNLKSFLILNENLLLELNKTFSMSKFGIKGFNNNSKFFLLILNFL